MKVWLLDHHPANDHLDFEDYDDHNRLNFDGKPLMDHWYPPKVTSHIKGRPTDFFNCHNGALLISQKAKTLLEAHIHPGEAEFLPLEHEGHSYYFMHILNIVSCIDADNSLEERIPNGLLLRYKEYAFHEELVKPHHVMRVKYHEGENLVNYPFISDSIRHAIVNSDLQGYQLIEMWDSAFSWKEKNMRFNEMVTQSNRERTQTFNYSTAIRYVEKRKMIVYSDRWAMKIDNDGDFLLGELLQDGTYSWIIPYFIPPVLLGQIWGIKDPLPGRMDRLKQGLSSLIKR